MPDVKTCSECFYEFVPDEGYEYTSKCIVCWKKEKGYKISKADEAHARLQKHLAEVCVDLRKQLDAAEKKAEKAAKAANEAKAAAKAKPNTSDLGGERISAARLKGLIRLCHPDRHGNSELSNEMTKWLLDMRGTT